MVVTGTSKAGGSFAGNVASTNLVGVALYCVHILDCLDVELVRPVRLSLG